MQLTSFEQINPEFLRKYRESRKESLKTFYGTIGSSISAGHSYEKGTTNIPEETKRLLFLHYGLGIPTDCQSEEFQLFVDALQGGKTLTLSKVIGLLGQVNTLMMDGNNV